MTAAATGDDPREHRSATTVLVVRHAESAANAGAYFASQSDSPLSRRGEEQAVQLSRALARTAIDAVYSSDLIRARRTIEAVATARHLPIHQTELLRERAMGELTGLTFVDAEKRYPEVWAKLVARDPHAAPPGGESHVELAARVSGFLGGMLPKHRGGTVLLASHGGTIHHIVRQLLGVHDLTITFALHVENASVSRIDLHERAGEPSVARLVYVNRIAHDTADLIER